MGSRLEGTPEELAAEPLVGAGPEKSKEVAAREEAPAEEAASAAKLEWLGEGLVERLWAGLGAALPAT